MKVEQGKYADCWRGMRRDMGQRELEGVGKADMQTQMLRRGCIVDLTRCFPHSARCCICVMGGLASLV